jgi:hypothetical protein
MFKDQLLLIVGFQHYRVLIEGADSAGELNSAQQIDGDVAPLFSGGVKERILNILCRLVIHSRSPWLLNCQQLCSA